MPYLSALSVPFCCPPLHLLDNTLSSSPPPRDKEGNCVPSEAILTWSHCGVTEPQLCLTTLPLPSGYFPVSSCQDQPRGGFFLGEITWLVLEARKVAGYGGLPKLRY